MEDCVVCSSDCGTCPEPTPDMMSDADGDRQITDGPQDGGAAEASAPVGGFSPASDEGCNCAAGQRPRGFAAFLFVMVLAMWKRQRR